MNICEQMADKLIEIEGMDKGKMCVADYQAYVHDMKKLADAVFPPYLLYQKEEDHFAALLVNQERTGSLVHIQGDVYVSLRALVRNCLSEAMDACDYNQYDAANFVEKKIEDILLEFTEEHK